MTTQEFPDGLAAFVRMTREYPVRTAIFSFGLPVFALLQLLNGVVHQGPLGFLLGFAVLAAVSSVLLTQYQLSVYRRRAISRQAF